MLKEEDHKKRARKEEKRPNEAINYKRNRWDHNCK